MKSPHAPPFSAPAPPLEAFEQGVDPATAVRAHACMVACKDVEKPGRLVHAYRRYKRNNDRLRAEKAQLLHALQWIAAHSAESNATDIEIHARTAIQGIYPESTY